MNVPLAMPGSEGKCAEGVRAIRARVGRILLLSACLATLPAGSAMAQQPNDPVPPTVQSELPAAPTDVSPNTMPSQETGVPSVPVRAARLTYVAEGVVLVDRGDGAGTEPAQQNMPLAQGTRLTSTANGQAEIEFEDGSVVRLTPNSAINLDYLGTDASGNATRLHVLHGLVYCELRASKTARFMVQAGGDSFWPAENATVRVNLDDPPGVISVLDGRILVEHISRPAGLKAQDGGQAVEGFRTAVHAGESLRSDASDPSRYFLADSIPPESWDNWNEGRDQAAADQLASRTPVREGFAGAQGYGWSDLDANGTWYNQPDVGPVWQPDEALAADFDPYGYGSWTYFGNAGYTWASGYSWGWTPYRCGQWNYWNSFGWGWQPNNFCQTYWNFGGGYFNIGRGPRGYVPIRRPIRHPIRPHPLIPGPHPGERPPAVRSLAERREPVERTIAGVAAQPIHPIGVSYTSRGGSAVGSELRRDYAIDAKTQSPVLGVPSNPIYALIPARPVSAGPGWHAVSTHPEPATQNPGFFRSIFGHGSHGGADSTVRLGPHGNPYLPPSAVGAHRPGEGASANQMGARSNMRPPTGAQPQGWARPPSTAQSGYRPGSTPPPSVHSQPSFQSAPQSHSSPSAPAAGRK